MKPGEQPYAELLQSRRRGWALPLFLLLSAALHAAVGRSWLVHPPRPQEEARWVEMAVVEAPPPPEPEPPEPEPPAPEPPKPKPKPLPEPEPVPFSETRELPEDAPASPPEERPRRVVRRVQGLSATSFAPGSGTGLRVRAGTTTAARADQPSLSLDEATDFDPLPLASVTTPPRACSHPPVQVPEAAIEAGYEGTIRLLLDLDARGRVQRVRVLDHAGYGVEEACRAAALQVRCKPARRDGQPVPVTGMPFPCTIRALD